MNGSASIRTPAALLAAGLLLLPVLATAGDGETRPVPPYKRSDSERAPVSKPLARKALAPALVIEAVEMPVVSERQEYGPPSAAGRTRPTPEDRQVRERRAWLDTMAIDAGRRTADNRIDPGRRQYYRVGFYEGQRAALTTHGIGNWDLVEGRRVGWRDRRARDRGLVEGRASAEQRAWDDAREQVAGQFMDLSREPRFLPEFSIPPFDPPRAAASAPTLDEVFTDFPLRSFGPPRQRLEFFFADWSYDGPSLYHCSSWSDVYDADWQRSSTNLNRWRRNRHRHRGPVNPVEFARFVEVYEAALTNRLSRLYRERLLPAHDLGFDDGFIYGAFVRQELEFRRGYHEGFLEARTDATIAAFERHYATAYEDAYAGVFAEWSDNPKPDLGAVGLRDGDDNGVTEPGEELLVDYEVINYGGAPGRFPVWASGTVLRDTARSTISVPARSSARGPRPLLVRVDPGTAPRTHHEIEFQMTDASRTLPLYVSYPLELERGSVRTDRDDLAGRVTVAVRLVNRSRRPVAGKVRLETGPLPTHRETADVGDLGPADQTLVSFDLEGLDPLKLMAGDVFVTLAAEGRGLSQDRLTHHLPDTARDLSDRSLLIYMLRLAEDERANPAEIEAARDLMLLRLREDWKVAVIARGNPFKADYKRGESRTALGDLVHTYRDRRLDLASPEVFAGLSGEITVLAATLPGAHPQLRKYVRRLATELP